MFRRLLPGLVAPLVVGCGTLANMDGRSLALMGLPDRETRPFGGVANDFRWVGEQAVTVVSLEEPWGVPLNIGAACFFGLIDLPFSLVGDIITLPKVIRGKRQPPPPLSDTPKATNQHDG